MSLGIQHSILVSRGHPSCESTNLGFYIIKTTGRSTALLMGNDQRPQTR